MKTILEKRPFYQMHLLPKAEPQEEVVVMGVAQVGEEADVIEDYKKAFGVSPPAVASIAIMNDSDNTGESSVSYIDFIEVFK